MSTRSNDNGRAYEFICLTSLHEAINAIRPAEIDKDKGFEAAERAWKTLSEDNKTLYTLSAQSTIKTIFALEPNIVEKTSDILRLYIQTDKKGVEADVRDIIIERKDIIWEIGLSIKHNHADAKHSRVSHTHKWAKSWYGVPCSQEYKSEVKEVFDLLKDLRKRKVLFNDIPDKENVIYVPLLNAIATEIQRQVTIDSSIGRKIVEYLLSKYDFYKVISVDSKRLTTIQSFNMYGTLNQPSRVEKPSITIPVLSLPTELMHIGFKQDSKTTIYLCFDNGWQFSLRLHNGESIACPSLKFAVAIVGMPAKINISLNCNWDK